MKHLTKRSALAAFAAIFFISFAAAQTGGTKKLDLDDCLEIALENNYDIKLAIANDAYNEANVTAAFGEFLPSADYSAGYSRQLNAQSSRTVNVGGEIIPIQAENPNSYRMAVGVNMTIFDGFARESGYSSALNAKSAGELTTDFVRESVASRVRTQYVNVVKKMKIVEIRSENVELGKKELENIQARHDAGLLPIGSVYSQEADLGLREYQLVVAENDLKQSQTQLLKTMGLEPDFRAEFDPESLPEIVFEESIEKFKNELGDYETAVQKAIRNRKDYKADELQIESAKSGITAAKSAYYPQIGASGGWSWTNNELDKFNELGRSYGALSFYLPLFQNFRTNLNVQRADLELTRAEYDKMETERQIRTDVITAMDNLEAAEKQLEITAKSLKSAERNYQSAVERYRVGTASVTDYLTANNQYVETQINRINAVYDYVAAQKQAMFAIGELTW